MMDHRQIKSACYNHHQPESQIANAIPSSPIRAVFTNVFTPSSLPSTPLRSSRTNRATRPWVALRISAALKLDLILRIIQSTSLLRWEDTAPRKRTSIPVSDLVGIALAHEGIVAAVRLVADEGVAVLIVLEAPGDRVVGAAACV